jgi:hypothetical protein
MFEAPYFKNLKPATLVEVMAEILRSRKTEDAHLWAGLWDWANAQCLRDGQQITIEHLMEAIPSTVLAAMDTIALSAHFDDKLNPGRLTLSPSAQHLLRICGQNLTVPIGSIFNEETIYKVNEGVYGEVYSGITRGGRNESVYKLVPIEGTQTVNGVPQTRADEVATEVKISQRLNDLRDPDALNFTDGFCLLYRSVVLHGRYPARLQQVWEEWDIRNCKTVNLELNSIHLI